MNLSESDRERLIKCIQEGKPIPESYRNLLFPADDGEYIEATKDYKLVYKGKTRKEDVLALTPAAPLQEVRSFNSDNPFDDNWRNLLIFGDNLMALKTLYDDQRGLDKYKTRNRIKLIYIDPPFATKQDFMKDREKAYHDKIIGAQFIEFLRKRLILMYEILASDGSIYVHLDWKKSHYIKSILDEIFGEHNFRNEITWKGADSHNDSRRLGIVDNKIFWYTKNENYKYKSVYLEYSQKYLDDFYNNVEIDSNGNERRFRLDHFTKPKGSIGYFYEYLGCNPPPNGWRCPVETMEKWNNLGLLEVRGEKIYKRRYLDEQKGKKITSVWDDISTQIGKESTNYPTQKPERIISRIIDMSSSNDDIVIDVFAGSGTTLAVAEKLGRRWIGMDCGKLAIYTIQKRMLELTTKIGSPKKDDRPEHERVEDFVEHLKSKSKGLLLISEKTRKGDLVVTDAFLEKLADFLTLYLPGNGEKEFSLICPEENFKVFKAQVTEPDDEKAGEKIIKVNGIKFMISFIQPKEKPEKEKPLKAKQFTLYNAGVYDEKAILNLPWEQYRGFVLKLFDVREMRHQIHGTVVDGYIGLHSALIWNYPEKKNLRLDHDYVESLHTVMGGKAGSRFYVIAPVVAMAFMEDEYRVGDTTYIFLKVPLSVLMALIKKGEAGSLKQPVKEADVNEVIDAVGFDFISQPVVQAKYRRAIPSDLRLFNANQKDYIIELTEFRSNTLVYDPEDFENFETLSMVLADVDYNGDVFRMSHVFWRDKIYMEDRQKAVLKIPEPEFTGNEMMIIMMDRYGNELKIVKSKADFK